MPHNKHLSFAGQWPGANTVYGPTLRQLDQAIFEAINGDDGGTWTPLTPVSIGGQGMRVTTTSSLISGDVITLPKSSGIKLLDNDWPTFVAARTRSVFVPFSSWTETTNDFSHNTDASLFFPKRNGLQPGAAIGITVPINDALRLHNGATLSSVDIRMRVPVPHQGSGSAAAIASAFSLYRTSPGATTQYLNSAGFGLVTDPVASLDAYYAAGLPRTVAYTCNQNNTVDTASWSYILQITDQADALGVQNEYLGATLNFTNILTMAFE